MRIKIILHTQKLNIKETVRSFTIKNTGNSPLIIENFTTSCECTLLNLRKEQTILPQDSLEVNLEIEQEKVGSGNLIYLTLKTNATPRLTSFNFAL